MTYHLRVAIRKPTLPQSDPAILRTVNRLVNVAAQGEKSKSRYGCLRSSVETLARIVPRASSMVAINWSDVLFLYTVSKYLRNGEARSAPHICSQRLRSKNVAVDKVRRSPLLSRLDAICESWVRYKQHPGGYPTN